MEETTSLPPPTEYLTLKEYILFLCDNRETFNLKPEEEDNGQKYEAENRNSS